jgi:hypothetical protein
MPAAPVVVHDVTLPVRCVDDGGALSWQVGDDLAGGRIWPERGGARVVAWDAAGDWESPVAMAALRFLAMEGMRACGLVPLHAAVIARGDAVVALLGPSGAGKSTTLLHAVREGWVPVSEDVAWVDPETLDVARGDRGVRLWPDARDRFVPWLAARSWQPEPDGKTLLPYEALGVALPPDARLSRVALLSAAAGGEAPLSPREIAVALLDAGGLAIVPASQRALGGHVARMAGRLRGERLPLGRLPRLDRIG